jgi:hypothetical protein
MLTPFEYEKMAQSSEWHEVKRADSTEPGEHQTSTKPGAIQELEPGEVRTVGKNWRNRDCMGDPIALPAGRYVGRGLWIARDEYGPEQGWWSNSMTFRIRR